MVRSARGAAERLEVFAERITRVLEGLLLETEDDMLVLDPSLSMTEQLRRRWLDDYDTRAAGAATCRPRSRTRRELAAAEAEVARLEGLRGGPRGQLQQLCRTLRHMDGEARATRGRALAASRQALAHRRAAASSLDANHRPTRGSA